MAEYLWGGWGRSGRRWSRRFRAEVDALRRRPIRDVRASFRGTWVSWGWPAPLREAELREAGGGVLQERQDVELRVAGVLRDGETGAGSSGTGVGTRG